MKLIFDHQIFSLQQYGGISRYFCELAKSINNKEGFDVEIFAPLHINEFLETTSDIHIYGKKINFFPLSYINRTLNDALSQIMIKSRKDIDIFHETYFSKIDNCPRSVKRVVTVYDMIHEKFPQNYSARKKIQKAKAHAVKRADHVICISENTRQELVDILNVPKEKTSVVYLGYSLSCKLDSIKPFNYKKPFILYVGERKGYKNFELMLRAYSFSKVLKSAVSIICFGGGKITAKERALITSFNLSPDSVRHIEGNDVVLAGLYGSAEVFIYPSLYEGFGIPPLEAMAFGCPVACSNTSSLPEVVGDAAELFDPASESDMRDAIEKVIFSPIYAEQLVIKGYERVKLFSWEKCAQNTLAVYEKVLQG